MCGFFHSTFLTTPVMDIGLVRSYSVENEWCARTGGTMTSAMSAAETAQVIFTRVAYTREDSGGADSFDTAAPAFVMQSRPMSKPSSVLCAVFTLAALFVPAAGRAQQT